MNASCSLFSQILTLIPHTDCERIVKERGAEYRRKGTVELEPVCGDAVLPVGSCPPFTTPPHLQDHPQARLAFV